MWKGDSETPKLPTIASLSNPLSQGKSSLRRVNVLNKLFMRHITDFMATDDTFSGYGLEISRVNITTDFRTVNVYWCARGDGSDDRLEAILSKAAGPLRHKLSQLRLMGEVPTIQFVKDKKYAKIVEVETLLKRADFGEDFVPSCRPSEVIKNDFSFNGIQSADGLPEMTHDVLGLNQAEIMRRIKQNMSKAKQAWEKYETKLPISMDEKLLTGEDRKEAIIKLKEEEFQAFLNQRKSRRNRERASRSTTENDDFDDDDDDIDQFEEQDTLDDDFENYR